MTPLQIEILFWYHCRREDFRQGDFSAPAVRDAIDAFRDRCGMIENIPSEGKDFADYRTYRLTQRGQAFVDHVCSLPLPIQKWEMPA